MGGGLSSALADAAPPAVGPLLSPRVGLVTAVEECMADVDEPSLVRVSCELAATTELIGVELGAAHGVGGSGFTRSQAIGAALGEAAERYSGCYVPHERLVASSAKALGRRAVDPASFGLFSPAQHVRPGFPFAPFAPWTELRWIEGTDLETGEPAWVPAELVLLAGVEPVNGVRVGYATSSGLACGRTEAEALERALFEVLERDAFMLAWWRRASPARLDWSGSTWLSATDERYFRGTGLEYHALDLSAVHDLPVVVGVVRGLPGSGAALGVGAAAAPRLEEAWWRALAEAFASRSACRKLRLLDPARRYADDGRDVRSFDDHIRFYGDDDRAAAAAFLWSSPATKAAGEVPPLAGDVAAGLVTRIARAGSRAIGVDVTAPDVAEAGLHVVKVVAPGLCALDAEHECRFLGAPRLLRPSETDILTPPPQGIDDLNPLPHPFP